MVRPAKIVCLACITCEITHRGERPGCEDDKANRPIPNPFPATENRANRGFERDVASFG